jgi:hypothetical protein
LFHLFFRLTFLLIIIKTCTYCGHIVDVRPDIIRMMMGWSGNGCNRLFQALYFWVPFRDQLLEHYATNRYSRDVEQSILICQADLFSATAIGPK